MLAYSLMNQGARHKIFPTTQRRGVGTLLMFVVRNLFSNAAYRRDVFADLVAQGHLDRSILSEADPLGFLLAEGGAESITDAAYRYARHEQGADVILFGTGNKDHVKANVDSILRPPLPGPVVERLHRTFGHLSGVGLDLPGPVKANVESILRPPLPAPVIERLHASFGHLTGVGLDLPGPVKA